MLFLLLLLWSQGASSEVFDRVYHKANLSITVIQFTADCHKAGTDSNIIINVGWLDFNNKLAYSIPTPLVKGKYGSNFERSDEHIFRHRVPSEDFWEVEKECVWQAGATNQDIYLDCLHPNLLYFQLYSWWNNWGPDWKPAYTYVSLYFHLQNGTVLEHEVKFKPRYQNCDVDWVKGEGDSYMCRDRPWNWEEYLDRGRGLKPGTEFNCDQKNRKLHTDCMGWTWYMANDVQFHIFSSVLIIMLYKYRNSCYSNLIVHFGLKKIGTFIDKKCPFTGNVSIRGRILNGVVIKNKMQRTIIIRRDYLHFVKKYRRYEERHRNVAVHCSPAFRDVAIGDLATVGECRPLSKTVRYNVLKIAKSGSAKKALNKF